MTRRYFVVWAFFFLEIAFCGLSNPILVGAHSSSLGSEVSESAVILKSRVHRDGAGTSNGTLIDKSSAQDSPLVVTNSNTTGTSNWLKDAASNKEKDSSKTSSIQQPPALSVPPLPPASTDSLPSYPKQTVLVKEKGPDLNFKPQKVSPEYDVEVEGNSTKNYSGQPKFDEKAVQRALVVCGGLAALIVVYFGVKFVFLRKRKVGKRYGRIDSEMDLLDEIEDDGDSEEDDDTLFDLNSTRRSQF